VLKLPHFRIGCIGQVWQQIHLVII
jgi:hypothetical protein